MLGRALHIVHPHGRSEDSHSPRRIGPFWKGSQKSMETGILEMDKICAVVAASDAASMRRQLVGALECTRTVELRLDWLSDVRELRRFLAWLASAGPRARLIAT